MWRGRAVRCSSVDFVVWTGGCRLRGRAGSVEVPPGGEVLFGTWKRVLGAEGGGLLAGTLRSDSC